MRKRSKYRPKGVRLDTMGYVTESITPVNMHESFAIDLRLTNHMAMATLTQGKATKKDIDVLIGLVNVTEALCVLGFGKEYEKIIDDGLTALQSLGSRGLKLGKFILKADEMQAINAAMELHDAQLDVITVKDMERALLLIKEVMRNKRATPIKEAK